MLILIGLRGSGKSTIGRMAAAQRGVRFVDLDDLTPQYAPGGPLGDAATLLRLHGEPTFRACELQALRALADDPPSRPGYLALGGGTPTHAPSHELLQRLRSTGTARLVYLRATPATLTARLRTTDLTTRPSLTGTGVLEEVQTLFDRRDPIYSTLADRVIEVDGTTPEWVVEQMTTQT